MTYETREMYRLRKDPEVAKRIPPGQFLTEKFPVLTYGPTPEVSVENYELRIWGLVEAPKTFAYPDLLALPQVEILSDFHCVTTWSQLDNLWKGIHIREILQQVKVQPEAKFVMLHAYGGYTTNIPLAVLDDEDVLLAYGRNGEHLSVEHGYPLRMVIPKRYAWKSCKWISGIEFMAEDRAGFWERNGYSMNADFWQEERYW
jgi:DMSO/TMAO reductase YedYZ molybdopterin-dependent catalytic subunit